jgi:hypothetical protein
MNTLHLLTTGVLANDPMVEWACNHVADSTIRKCFETYWTFVTHNEDRANKIVHQARNVPMDVKVLIDQEARIDRDSSTLTAIRSLPEGDWIWIIPEGAMVDVHSGGEVLKLTSLSDSPIAVEKDLCLGVDHLIFRRPSDSVLDGSNDAREFFTGIRKRARSMPVSDVYISRGAENDFEKLCVMYWNMKFWKHRYSRFYNDILAPMRGKGCNLLEIGVAFGGSLRTWRDYLGDGVVAGLDSYAESALSEYGLVSFTGDSTTTDSASELTRLYPKNFDVIVDDGDHDPQAQLKTARNFMPMLTSGGRYIIETAHGFEWLAPELEKSFGGMQVSFIDQRARSGYGDSVVISMIKSQST